VSTGRARRRPHGAAAALIGAVTAVVCLAAGCGTDATGTNGANGAPPVTVAVIDTGVAAVGAVRDHRAPGVRCDPVCRAGDGPDVDGHGTAVANLVLTGVGADPARTITPPAVDLVAVQVTDDRGVLSLEGVAAGIRWAAERGVPVVALPLVLGGGDPGVAAAIRSAPATLFVVPAGNDGLDLDERSVPVHPCVDPTPNVVCVAATDGTGRLSGSSNRGAVSVDVAAPGVDLATVDPSGRTIRVSGTSYAVPLVARAAAQLMAERPGSTPESIAAALRCGGPDGTLRVLGTEPGATGPTRPCGGSLG
jgi:hypothetical protein